MLHRTLFCAAVVVALSNGCASDAPTAKKPLFERLGGTYPIAVVVDDFIERLLVNDTLNANAAIKDARDRVPKPGLKFQVTALVAQVTGGPYVYQGRDMKASHAHLGITEKEWEAMAGEFKKSLDKYKVPEAEQKELFEIVGTTKKDIVTGPAKGPMTPMAKPTGDSLYARLGGIYPIACVVDVFIERLLVNNTLNANAAIRDARDRVPKAGLKFQVAALVAEVTGGPYTYHGRSMKASHAALGISGKEWDAMAADFKATLDQFKVPEKEQKELFDIVGKTKGDIITK